jgi:hypothetical protein
MLLPVVACGYEKEKKGTAARIVRMCNSRVDVKAPMHTEAAK